MEKVTHLWNVNQLVSQLKRPQLEKLQAFYVQCCRNFEDEVELPKQRFGPQIMCSHCGSLWSNVDHKVRIISARKPTGALKRAIKLMVEFEQRVPRVRATLIRKCIKNQMNKVQMTCSLCNLKTEIPFVKPQKEKRMKGKDVVQKPLGSQKKKKKRKDKTAGLNISSNLSSPSVLKHNESPAVPNIKKPKTNTQTPKLKKLRIDKLKEVVNQSTPLAHRKSLQNFLSELS